MERRFTLAVRRNTMFNAKSVEMPQVSDLGKSKNPSKVSSGSEFSSIKKGEEN